MIKKTALVLSLLMCASCAHVKAAERKSGWFMFTASLRGLIGTYLVVTGVKEFVDLGRSKTAITLANTADGNVVAVDVQVPQGSVFWGIIRTSLGATILYNVYHDVIDEEKSESNQTVAGM